MKDHISSHYMAPIVGLAQHPILKGLLAWLFAILSDLFSEMFVVRGAIVSLVCFGVLVDALTGILAAKRRKEKITSWGLRRTVVKLLEYLAVLLMAIALSNVFAVWLGWLVEFVAAYLALTEFRSILENTGHGDIYARIKDRLWPTPPPGPPTLPTPPQSTTTTTTTTTTPKKLDG